MDGSANENPEASRDIETDSAPTATPTITIVSCALPTSALVRAIRTMVSATRLALIVKDRVNAFNRGRRRESPTQAVAGCLPTWLADWCPLPLLTASWLARVLGPNSRSGRDWGVIVRARADRAYGFLAP
jgi:hypothetical protein